MPFVILKGISKFATKFRGKKIFAYYLLIDRTPPFIYTVGFACLALARYAHWMVFRG